MVLPIEARWGDPMGRVAIVYTAGDDPDHLAWVEALGHELRVVDGHDARLDLWDATPGRYFPSLDEAHIRDAEFVLLVCTTAYKGRFDPCIGGVGDLGNKLTDDENRELLYGRDPERQVRLILAGP